jgi:hypothetical protein
MTDLESPGSRAEAAPPPAKPGRKRPQRSGKRLLTAPDAAPRQASGGHETSPDIGCYQARHRLLTGRIAMPLAAGLTLLAGGIYLMVISWPLPSGQDLKGVLFPILLGGALVLPYVLYVILLAGRVAFRADQAGITLPPMPHATLLLWVFTCHCESEFIPWSHVKGITVGTIGGKRRARLRVPVIDIHHSYSRDAHGSYALRSIITWRLDRNRLAAVVTAAAPGIPIVERGRI